MCRRGAALGVHGGRWGWGGDGEAGDWRVGGGFRVGEAGGSCGRSEMRGWIGD